MQKAERLGARIVVHGTYEQGVIAAFDPGGRFTDTDGDGLTDRTEAAFGTDPKRADTDGDGVPDGRDVAPLALPARDAAGEVTGEMLRFAALFMVGGPISLQGDRAGWSESPSAAALLLHVPADVRTDDQACEGRHERTKAGADQPRAARTPFPIARVESLKIDGDRAQGRFIWSRQSSHHARDLGLARVKGKWRVVDDRPVANYH